MKLQLSRNCRQNKKPAMHIAGDRGNLYMKKGSIYKIANKDYQDVKLRLQFGYNLLLFAQSSKLFTQKTMIGDKCVDNL